jgi:hypothetical protein
MIGPQLLKLLLVFLSKLSLRCNGYRKKRSSCGSQVHAHLGGAFRGASYSKGSTQFPSQLRIERRQNRETERVEVFRNGRGSHRHCTCR